MSDQQVKYQKLKKIFGLQLFANFHKVLLYAMGIGLVSFGLYYSYYNWLLIKFSPSSYDSYFLRSKIAKSYKKYKSLVRLTILKSRKVIDKSGITFCFSYLDKLKTKPSLLQNQQKANPFLPPFEEGQFIIELDRDHNLLFNKFAVVEWHLLIVKKYFEDQEEMLTRSDFSATIRAMRSIQGFGYYNCGEFSGMSVRHKHIQVIPFNENEYPVFNLIKKKIKNKEINQFNSKLSEFKFNHCIKIFENYHDENSEKAAEQLELLYRKALTEIQYFQKKQSFNAIFTEDWIMIIPRSKECAFNRISVNSMGFTGNILIKNEEDWELVNKLERPMEILEDITT